MQFLRQEIPDAPADCAKAANCTFNVRALEIFATGMGISPQETTSGAVDATPPRAEGTAIQDFTTGPDPRNVLPNTMERLMPAATRCGEACVINCALKVLWDGGKI